MQHQVSEGGWRAYLLDEPCAGSAASPPVARVINVGVDIRTRVATFFMTTAKPPAHHRRGGEYPLSELGLEASWAWCATWPISTNASLVSYQLPMTRQRIARVLFLFAISLSAL